jgi:methionyl-tRNA formyltransferase
VGNAEWSVPSLEALAGSSHRLELIATRARRPAGRGSRLTPTPVARAARRLGLPLAEVATVKSGEGLESLKAAAPDVLAVVAYGEILPPAVLEIPKIAPVNVHFSFLPELRGAAPVQRALMEGMPATGVTTIRMDAGMDTGPILLQAREAILPEDDAGSLGARLAAIGGRLLVETLDRLEAGTLEERPQDDALATYAPKLKPDERMIDWSRPAEEIVRQVRALAPEPGAIATFRGRNLKVLRGSVSEPPDQEVAPAALSPGQVADSFTRGSRQGVWVLTGSGVLLLEEVQPEGRSRMSGGEFARGYRPEIGERLA